MKTHRIIISARKLLMLSLLFVASLMVNAQTKNAATAKQNDWIKFLGSNKGAISFDISYNNTTGEKISMAVFDEDHNSLFKKFYTARNLHIIFQVASGLTSELEFVLKNADGEVLSRSFKISFESKIDVRETEVHLAHN